MGTRPITKAEMIAGTWRGFTGGQITRPSRSSSGGGGGTVVTAPKASNVYSTLKADYEEAQAEQEKRYKQGLVDLAKVTGLYGPDYGAGMEQAALAGAKQSLIGRGLGGGLSAYVRIAQDLSNDYGKAAHHYLFV